LVFLDEETFHYRDEQALLCNDVSICFISFPVMFQSINNFTASIGRQRAPFLALREKRKEKHQRVSSLIKVSAAQITFVDPDGKEISTSSSSGIVRNLALENNVEIYEGFNKLLNCGGNGQCGTCGMIITTDGKDVLSAPTEVERKKLGEAKLNKGYRLSCQTEILSESEAENAINITCKTKPPKK